MQRNGCLPGFSLWGKIGWVCFHAATPLEKPHSVGAGGGVDGEAEELVLQVFFGGTFGTGRTAGGRGDNGEDLEFGDGCSGDVDALRVGASVRRGEEEAVVFGEGIEERPVGGCEAFEEIAGAEGKAEPEALGAGTGEEGPAGEALGVDGVGEVEVADVADGLDVVDWQGDNATREIEEADRTIAREGGLGQVAGEYVCCKAAYEDFFRRIGHGLGAVRRRSDDHLAMVWLWPGAIVAWDGWRRYEKGANRLVKAATPC